VLGSMPPHLGRIRGARSDRTKRTAQERHETAQLVTASSRLPGQAASGLSAAVMAAAMRIDTRSGSTQT